MTLTEFLKGIADAIRNKKRTTEKIKASDFANEITNLPSGGGPISQEEYDMAVNTTENILNGAVGYDWNGKMTQTRYMFSNYTGTELDLTGLNTSNVTDMNYMFNYCSNLTKLNLKNFNTDKVIYMTYMFTSCRALTELNLENFNTSNVTDMSNMFSSCYALTKLNLENFNTDKVTSMTYMFSNCRALTELNLKSFNTENVTSMSRMFASCNNLIELNLKNFNPVKVTSYSYMFSSVPTTVKIITNQTMANWLNAKFPTYTNIEIVKADWEV